MKNICLASIPAPWFFGPYAKQLYMLAAQFIKIKKNYNIYYLCLGFDMKKQIYTYNEVLENFDKNFIDNKIEYETNIINKKNILEKIKFIGGIEKINGGYPISSFNDVISYFKIDCIITCMDVVTLINDDFFKIKSLTWYPNHFQPIRMCDITKLQSFSHIISLCPTDTKLLNNSLNKKKVSYIPHIIDFNISSEEIDKYKLRIKYNIPLDAFVILINAGNYEIQNRKSFDTSIFAFEQFLSKRRNAFLYIHSFNVKSFNDKNNFISSTGNMFNIKDLISQTEIPENRVKINEDILSDNEIIELMQFSDVLLQCSKSEGFGVPILEAQLAGLPVITTKFGAMDDYTFYGISVEPLQKMYEPTACGVWVVPNINGICNALLSVANYEIEDKKEFAKKKIIGLMSVEEVSNSFIKIIEEPFDFNDYNVINLSLPNFTPISHIIYDNKSNSFYIDQEKCSNIDSKKLNKEWILFTDNTVSVDFEMIQVIMRTIQLDDPTNLILFKTNFNNNIYPLIEDINPANINIDFNKMYYCIKRKFFTSSINNATIENKFMREFILRHSVNICKVSLAEHVALKEITTNNVKGVANNVKGETNNVKGVANNVKGIANDVKGATNDVNENIVIEISNLNTTTENYINDTLTNIHSKLKIKYGNLNEELPEQKMAVRYLTGNEKVLEIGGNIGRNSLVIASILKNTNNFVTLESDVNTANQLTENRDLNNFKFHIEKSALSNRSLIQRGWDTIPSDTLRTGYNWVNTITYDKLKTKYNIEFDTLVLDCEGALYYILMDMPEILNNINLIIMENDYHDISHKHYIDSILKKYKFYNDYKEAGGWEPCFNNFFEVWKK